MIWPFKRCPHARLRCTHGDEIIARGFARAVCRDCGRALKREPLPVMCFYTGEPHLSRAPEPDTTEEADRG